MPASDVVQRLARGMALAGLHVEGEAPAADSAVRHVTAQPAQRFHGRIADWVQEVRDRRAAGETVVFVAETAGRAERTVEMLGDYDVGPSWRRGRASYLRRGDRRRRLAQRRRAAADAALALYAETDIFEEDRHRGGAARKRSLAARSSPTCAT